MHTHSALVFFSALSIFSLGEAACRSRTRLSSLSVSDSSSVSQTLSTSTSQTITLTSSTSSSTTISSTETIATTTSSSTSTSSAAAAATPAVVARNYGFDNSPTDMSPWVPYRSPSTSYLISLDTSLQHDGPQSAKFTNGVTGANYITQPFVEPNVQAGVTYQLQAWFYTNSISSTNGCTAPLIACTSNGFATVLTLTNFPASSALNNWYQGTTTCTFTQSQIDQGLTMLFGWNCRAGGTGWVDTVTVTALP